MGHVLLLILFIIMAVIIWYFSADKEEQGIELPITAGFITWLIVDVIFIILEYLYA